jgi:hypothetical protein
LPTSSLEPLDNGHQHLVSSASLEDDGLGEELQAIWEINPTHESKVGEDDPEMRLETRVGEPERVASGHGPKAASTCAS